MFSLIIFYIFLIAVTLLLSIGMTVLLLKRFSAPKSTAIFSLFPLALFGLGFVLRLTAEPALIDIGFFFTEFSYLFIYVLFTLSLVLGQVKYWGISSKPHKTR